MRSDGRPRDLCAAITVISRSAGSVRRGRCSARVSAGSSARFLTGGRAIAGRLGLAFVRREHACLAAARWSRCRCDRAIATRATDASCGSPSEAAGSSARAAIPGSRPRCGCARPAEGESASQNPNASVLSRDPRRQLEIARATPPACRRGPMWTVPVAQGTALAMCAVRSRSGAAITARSCGCTR